MFKSTRFALAAAALVASVLPASAQLGNFEIQLFDSAGKKVGTANMEASSIKGANLTSIKWAYYDEEDAFRMFWADAVGYSARAPQAVIVCQPKGGDKLGNFEIQDLMISFPDGAAIPASVLNVQTVKDRKCVGMAITKSDGFVAKRPVGLDYYVITLQN